MEHNQQIRFFNTMQRILNRKEIKKVMEIIKSQWSADVRLDYAFFISGKDRIYIINKEIANFELGSLRINSVGLYFGEYTNGSLRLSIEGSQIIGRYAKKNIIEIDYENARKWMNGQTIEIKNNIGLEGFVILKNKNDFLGCGKAILLNNAQEFSYKILNYVPKNRRHSDNSVA